MINDVEQEKLIDEITQTVKDNGSLLKWQKDRKHSSIVNLLSTLNSLPKTSVPSFDFSRVRGQILDRIAVPSNTANSGWFASLGISLPRLLSISAGVLGTLMIVISLAAGTAVAALQSLPGQAIYPLKQIVENIQLKFTPEDQKASLQLTFADNRVDEIQTVLDQRDQGQLTDQEAQKIVSASVQDLQKTTAAATDSNAKQPKVGIVNKLTNLTNKLKAASINTEGGVKIEIEKAVQSTQISQEQAVKNIENAGIKIEDQPINIENSVTASGKLTGVTEDSVSIGTAKFLLSKDTKYVNITAKDLKVDQVVDIHAQIKDNKTYAQIVTLILDPKVKGVETELNNTTDLPTTDTNPDTPKVP